MQLFRRKARGVELTEAGRTLLGDTRAILARVADAAETTRRTARGEQGRLCVGLTPTAPFHPFVPAIIRAFRDAFPLVSPTLEECFSPELVERLRHGRIDAAFLRTHMAAPEGLVIYPLLEELVVAAMPVGHALAGGDGRGDAALPLTALAGETFIVYRRGRGRGRGRGHGLYDATVSACLAAGFSPRLGQEAPSITSTLGLVAARLGISLVPASMQRMLMDGVVYRRLRGAALAKAILTVAPRRGDPSAVVRHFLGMVRRAARNTEQQPAQSA